MEKKNLNDIARVAVSYKGYHYGAPCTYTRYYDDNGIEEIYSFSDGTSGAPEVLEEEYNISLDDLQWMLESVEAGKFEKVEVFLNTGEWKTLLGIEEKNLLVIE